MRTVGLTAPDVGHADLRHRELERGELRGRVVGKLEASGHRLHVAGLPAAELEHLGERVGGLGARDAVPGVELELVGPRGVVEVQPEQARHHLGAEVGRRLEAHALGLGLERLGRGGEAELACEQRVEASDRDRSGGDLRRGSAVLGADRGEGQAKLGARERPFAVEPAGQLGHQAGTDHLALLLAVPARLGHGSGRSGTHEQGGDGGAGKQPLAEGFGHQGRIGIWRDVFSGGRPGWTCVARLTSPS